MKKVLFLTGKLFPCNSGDSIFSLGILENLSKDYSVDVMCLLSDKLNRKDKDFEKIKEKINNWNFKEVKINKKQRIVNIVKYGNNIQRYDQNLKIKLEDMISNNKYSFLVVDHLRMGSYLTELKEVIKKTGLKITYISHNIEYKNIEETIKYERNFFRKFKKKFLISE